MKNKLIALLTSGAMVMGGGLSVFAQESDEAYPNEIISEDGVMPAYVALIHHSCSIEDTSSRSILKCKASTDVLSGYIAGVIVNLQQYDGGWKTIKTWSSGTYNTASVNKNYAVASGYKYRLEVSHIAYDSNWNELDVITDYSNSVSR